MAEGASVARQAMPGYFASVSELDSQFGKLLDVTDKTEKSRGRIVVFTADRMPRPDPGPKPQTSR